MRRGIEGVICLLLGLKLMLVCRGDRVGTKRAMWSVVRPKSLGIAQVRPGPETWNGPQEGSSDQSNTD